MAILKLFWGEQQATVALVAVACIISGINDYSFLVEIGFRPAWVYLEMQPN